MKFLNSVTVSMIALTSTFLGSSSQVEAGTDPFIGDIISVGYTFCPRGWLAAEGQLLPISSNTALFSLIGVVYGGDGRTTFGIPDLRGRLAMGQGHGLGLTSHRQGEKLGAEDQVLLPSQLPSHSHTVNANNLDGNKPGPGNKILSAAPPNGTGSETIYSTQAANTQLSSEMIEKSGLNEKFNTQDPFQVIRYCIAIQGIYPSRS